MNLASVDQREVATFLQVRVRIWSLQFKGVRFGSDRMADVQEMSVAKEVPFHTLCLLMEKISDAKGKEKKKGMFAKFLEHWKITHNKIHGERVIKVSNLSPSSRPHAP